MRNSLQITGRDFELTDAIKRAVREGAEKLDHIYENIISCKVTIESPRRRHEKATFYDVLIDLTVPGEDIVVKRELNEDLYAAVGEAFDAAQRQVQEFANKRRGRIKKHEENPSGKIHFLFPDRGYGFITAADGREIYFNENSVLNSYFKKLKVGDEVRFVEEMGEKGPQASTVRF
jgi:ribosomal subunit interface protein